MKTATDFHQAPSMCQASEGGGTFVAQLKEMQLGGYFVIPAKAPHYGECKGDTIIEVHTTGPLGTTYVNAADDPSKK